MILNVSGRTDIVAFYTPWFLKRIEEGYVDVRNPFYPKQISRVLINPKTIDAIIFCTKNPLPIIPYLDKLRDYPYVFEVTITPYGKDIEPFVPPKKDIIKGIIKISSKIGKDKIIIRYDPILLNDKYNILYHKRAFTKLLTLLDGCISKIIISFVDLKKNTLLHQKAEDIMVPNIEEIKELATIFGSLAKQHHIQIQTCAENYDLTSYGFSHESCISKEQIYNLTGKTKGFKKSTNRSYCNCLQSVDIGFYNSCAHFCKYCYANYDESQVKNNMKKHNPDSSLLIGGIEEDDIIKIREK